VLQPSSNNTPANFAETQPGLNLETQRLREMENDGSWAKHRPWTWARGRETVRHPRFIVSCPEFRRQLLNR